MSQSSTVRAECKLTAKFGEFSGLFVGIDVHKRIYDIAFFSPWQFMTFDIRGQPMYPFFVGARHAVPLRTHKIKCHAVPAVR